MFLLASSLISLTRLFQGESCSRRRNVFNLLPLKLISLGCILFCGIYISFHSKKFRVLFNFMFTWLRPTQKLIYCILCLITLHYKSFWRINCFLFAMKSSIFHFSCFYSRQILHSCDGKRWIIVMKRWEIVCWFIKPLNWFINDWKLS